MSKPLTTPSALSEYLNLHSQPHKSISLLGGGLTNFVYRVTLPNDETIVYKHTAPHMASNTSFVLDAARMNYEARALSILPPLLESELGDSEMKSDVHPAQLLHYDEDAKLLCISDGGERTLKVAYSDPEIDVLQIGRDLGQWIAALHASTRRTTLHASGVYDEENPTANNNPIALAIYGYSYTNLRTALEAFGEDPAFGDRINEEFGSRIAHEDDHVCHGDFWPGNVLVKEGSKDGDGAPKITIVDWEIVRRGTGATDVGQFAAEAFLLDRFKGGKGLCAAFLNAYAEALQTGDHVGRQWVRRMVVHWAVHVAFWPTYVKWTDKEGTRELVRLGVKVMRMAVEDDWECLKRCELFQGVSDTWRKWWDEI